MAYDCPHCQKAIPDAIPKDRFDEIYNERKALKTKVEDFEKSGKTADVLAKQLEVATGEIAALKSKHEVDLVMLDLGIKDADVRDALEWQYGKLSPEGRAPFTDTVKTWHAEPDKAPAVVRSLLPKPAAVHQGEKVVDAAKPNGATPPRPGFGRHTTGLEGSGSSNAFEPGSLRAKRAAGTLTQADIDAAAALLNGKQAS